MVNNPTDKSAAFCIPVAVVCFGGNRPQFTTPVPQGIAGPSKEEQAMGSDEAADQSDQAMQCQFR